MNAQSKYPEFLDDQRAYFDELVTEEWDSYVAVMDDWNRTRQFEIDQMLAHAPRPVRTVLDVGCGSGGHSAMIAERPGVQEVLGIDYSARSIEVAQREYPHPNVRRQVADIFTMEPSRHYDLVFSICVLPHLRNPVEFLAACARQLTPDGVVVATTPNRDRLENRLRRRLGRSDALIDPQHYREYTTGEMADLGREAGLRMVSAFAYGWQLTTPWGAFIPPRDVALGHRMPAIATRFGAVYRPA